MIYTVDVDHDHLAEVVFISKVIPFPSHLSILYSLMGSYAPVGWNIYIIYLEFLCTGKWLLLPFINAL